MLNNSPTKNELPPTSLLLTIKKWCLLAILLIVSFCFFYFDCYHYLHFNSLKLYQATLQNWTLSHYKMAVLLYLLIFTSLIACAIPCATILTLIGGFLFGAIAIVYAMLGTTLGGIILFLAVRTALGHHFARKSSGWIKKIEAGFQQNAFHYLVMLRLVPVFPCWISNIGAGLLNVPLKTFMLATLLGILPATAIYALLGRGLDKYLAMNQADFLNALFTPSILFPLLGLAIFSLFPVFYKRIKKR